MINLFSGVKSPTPAIIENWKNRYGAKLATIEVDGLRAFIREPTEKEIKKIVKKLVSGGKAFDETKFLKKAMETGWLGGDKELMNNQKVIQENLKAWQI